MAPPNGTSPPIARSRVDLPAPFGPITVTHDPAGTLRSTPCRIGCPSSATLTASTSTAALTSTASALIAAAGRSSQAPSRTQHHDEEGCPEERGDHADRDLGRRQHGAGGQI